MPEVNIQETDLSVPLLYLTTKLELGCTSLKVITSLRAVTLSWDPGIPLCADLFLPLLIFGS